MSAASVSVLSTWGGAAVGDIEGIDLSAITAWFAKSACWPDHVANEVEIEYRRYLLLQRSFDLGNILPSGLVLQFFRRHAAVLASPDLVAAGDDLPGSAISPDGPADPWLVNLYEQAFARPIPPYWNMLDISEASLDSSSPTLE